MILRELLALCPVELDADFRRFFGAGVSGFRPGVAAGLAVVLVAQPESWAGRWLLANYKPGVGGSGSSGVPMVRGDRIQSMSIDELNEYLARPRAELSELSEEVGTDG